MSNKYRIAILYGTAHGINDFIAGFLLALLSVQSDNWQLNSVAFLGYSIIAFGGQLPAGIMVDKLKELKSFSLFSLVLMLIAIVVSFFNIYAAILLSGLASAFIHVCGGAACYIADSKSNTLSGIFTSPGVLGLITGGILGSMQFHYFYILLLPLSLLVFHLSKTAIPSYSKIQDVKAEPLLDTHDFFMLILLLAIALRSLFWNLMHMMSFDNTKWLLGLGISAASGKLLGGYLADRTDWKKCILFSMLCSVVLLNFGKDYFPFFCLGVALLQSAVPLTLLLMQNYMSKTPATAAGLSLGAAILLAGLPAYFQQFRLIKDNNFFVLLLITGFLLSNYWIVRNAKRSA